MLDVADFERRHQRGDDASLIEVVRAVQQTHDSAIAKLVEAGAQLATATAVQATTISQIAQTQHEHATMLRENDIQHGGMVALARFAIWFIPIVISVVIVVVNVTLFLIGRR